MAKTQQRKKYFISEHLHREVFHGGIGNVDAEKILLQQEYERLFFPAHYDFSIWGKLKRTLYLLKCWMTIPSNAIVVFQFPLLATMNRLLLSRLVKKGVTCICFIADIDGIKDGDDRLLQKEISELRRFNRFIVHNREMKKWLLANVAGTATVSEIEFFDFLVTPFTGERKNDACVVFAGNLEKSGFINQLGRLHHPGSTLRFRVYGPGETPALQLQPNVEYKGVYGPDVLLPQVQGSFGLVWDGDSIDETDSSSLGRYMAYISHHKLSLYIAAGLPVITADSAASAYLVTKYGIGYPVRNLQQLEPLLASVDDAAYQKMRENLQALATRITTGQGLIDALRAHEQQLY